VTTSTPGWARSQSATRSAVRPSKTSTRRPGFASMRMVAWKRPSAGQNRRYPAHPAHGTSAPCGPGPGSAAGAPPAGRRPAAVDRHVSRRPRTRRSRVGEHVTTSPPQAAPNGMTLRGAVFEDPQFG
jgi:hypothetical protein